MVAKGLFYNDIWIDFVLYNVIIEHGFNIFLAG